VRSLIESGYVGAVYPVNPNIEVVSSIKTYPSVLAIPGEVEMAILAVPAPVVLKVAEECGQKGVRGLIVISDGFKESGPEGAAAERELREIAFGYGMRIVGPNCMGVINTDPTINMNATFSPAVNQPGNVSFLSQSGAMGEVILDYARSLNIGLSTFVSAGNRADVSPNDLVQYWEHDPATKVILLYLESFGNPHNFVRITRRVSAKKPIIVVKSGSTSAGCAQLLLIRAPWPLRRLSPRRYSTRPVLFASTASRSCLMWPPCFPINLCPKAGGWSLSLTAAVRVFWQQMLLLTMVCYCRRFRPKHWRQLNPT